MTPQQHHLHHSDAAPGLHQVYLGLGSNQGRRHQLLTAAVQRLAEQVGRVERVSSFIESEPWGYESEHNYLNAVVRCRTHLTPQQLLTATQQIERQLGRTTKTVDGQYHDRPIDIDILLYDDWHVNTPTLTIPHPRMLERQFVLQPLREVMPDEQYRQLIQSHPHI